MAIFLNPMDDKPDRYVAKNRKKANPSVFIYDFRNVSIINFLHSLGLFHKYIIWIAW